MKSFKMCSMFMYKSTRKNSENKLSYNTIYDNAIINSIINNNYYKEVKEND